MSTTADKEELETKTSEFEGIVHPIFKKYQGGAPGAGGSEDGGDSDEEMPGSDEL